MKTNVVISFNDEKRFNRSVYIVNEDGTCGKKIFRGTKETCLEYCKKNNDKVCLRRYLAPAKEYS